MKFTEQSDARYQGDKKVVKYSIRSRLMAVCDQLDALYSQLQPMFDRLRELQAQGITEATIHWREPGMLELLYPAGSDYVARTGRRREYIGKDPAKQQEAIARVNRREEYLKLEKEINRTKYKMQEIIGKISMLEWAALGEQKTFGDDWSLLASSNRPQEMNTPGQNDQGQP